MDAKSGSEKLIKEILLPNLRPMYEDLMQAVEGADLLISGEVVFPAEIGCRKNGHQMDFDDSRARFVFFRLTTRLLPPTAQWLKHLRFLGAPFHRHDVQICAAMIDAWLEPYREFRRELGLDENHDPIFFGKIF